jgi:hypothetical protein
MHPEIHTGARPMPSWLKGGFLGALVLAACWGSAISYWRTTQRMPAAGELMLYLFGLPLFMVLAFWSGRKLIAKRAGTPAAAVASTPGKSATEQPQSASLAILATSLRLPYGGSAEECAAAIADNKARPDLDQELLDDDGFPVMAARSSDAVDEALQEEITEWLARNGMAELHLSDEQWRALTLASSVAGELGSHSASELIPQEGSPPKLRLVLSLPAEWNMNQRRAAGMWLKHTVTQFGWPAEHISLSEEALADSEAIITPTAILNRLARDAEATVVPMVAMVVACASHIGDETIARWAANGTLFTSLHPGGAIPGEGAAGLLLTDLRQAGSIEGAAFVQLPAMEEARRDSSADEVRRVDSKLLAELTERALKRSSTGLSDVAMVVADTAHRSSRALELMGFVSAAMPHLDGDGDVVRVGLTSGTCGAVPFISALALARHYALERQASVLGISNEDPYRRFVTVIRPASS